MKQTRTLISPEKRLIEVQFQTHLSRQAAERACALAENLNLDPEHDKRTGEQLCRTCYYMRRHVLAGQAITDTVCRFCDEEMQFNSTYTDALCLPCAKKYRLCKHCVADIEFRVRKKM